MSAKKLEYSSALLAYWMVFEWAFNKETQPLRVSGSLNGLMQELGIPYEGDTMATLDCLAERLDWVDPMHRREESKRW